MNKTSFERNAELFRKQLEIFGEKDKEEVKRLSFQHSAINLQLGDREKNKKRAMEARRKRKESRDIKQRNIVVKFLKKAQKLQEDMQGSLVEIIPNTEMQNLFEDLEEMVETVGEKLEVKISFHKYKPILTTGDFSTKNMNKYEELKEFVLEGGFVTPENHKGIKTRLVGKKKKSYKQKKDGE